MKRGKDVRDLKGKPIERDAAREVSVLMFVLVEHSPGAFTLRLVSNDELLEDLRKQGTLKTLLDDADHLYADFRARFEQTSEFRPSQLTNAKDHDDESLHHCGRFE